MTKISKKKFYFVRHGNTDWNDQQLCQGQLDIELNEAGRQEAHVLAQSLHSLPISKIYTSPLLRALETAQILHSTLKHASLQIVDELKERSWGKLEGISSKEMYHIEELEEAKAPLPPLIGVETREAFKSRILHGMNIVLQNHEEPLIVSHGRVFLALCELLEIPLIRQIPNTTLIEFTPSNKGWEVQ